MNTSLCTRNRSVRGSYTESACRYAVAEGCPVTAWEGVDSTWSDDERIGCPGEHNEGNRYSPYYITETQKWIAVQTGQ
jgi:hypothetical protein